MIKYKCLICVISLRCTRIESVKRTSLVSFGHCIDLFVVQFYTTLLVTYGAREWAKLTKSVCLTDLTWVSLTEGMCLNYMISYIQWPSNHTASNTFPVIF